MRSVVPKGERPQYPGFSDDPLDGFRHLAHDLRKYCADFLVGSGADFQAAKKDAEAWEKKTDIERLSGFEP
jgi:hypothetical protein